MTFPLYLDENVDPEVAVRLRRDGYDVTTSQEARLAGSRVSDEVQLQYAAGQNRALVTHDVKSMPGLAQRWLDTGKEHAGVILCDFRPPDELYRRLRSLLEQYDGEALKNGTLWLPPVQEQP